MSDYLRHLQSMAKMANEFNRLAQGGGVLRDLQAHVQANNQIIEQMGEHVLQRNPMLQLAREIERPNLAMARLGDQHVAVVETAHRVLADHRAVVATMNNLVPRLIVSYPNILESSADGSVSVAEAIRAETGIAPPELNVPNRDAVEVAQAAEEMVVVIGDEASALQELADLRGAIEGLADAVERLSKRPERGSRIATLGLIITRYRFVA